MTDADQPNPLAIGVYCDRCFTRLDDKATGSSPSHACPICGDDK